MPFLREYKRKNRLRFPRINSIIQGLKKKELDEEKEILVYVKHGETVYHGHTCPEIKDEIDIKVLELYTAKQLNYKPCSICFYLELKSPGATNTRTKIYTRSVHRYY